MSELPQNAQAVLKAARELLDAEARVLEAKAKFLDLVAKASSVTKAEPELAWQVAAEATSKYLKYGIDDVLRDEPKPDQDTSVAEQVRTYFRSHAGKPVRLSQVYQDVKANPKLIRATASRLAQDGVLDNVDRGVYSLNIK